MKLILSGLGFSLLVGWSAVWNINNLQIEARARAGDLEARYQVAKSSLDGSNPALDPIESLRIIRQAAEKGNPKAQTALGILYANGALLPRDFDRASKWLRLAANQDFVPAQERLARLYSGKPVSDSRERAIKWFRRGAAQVLATAKPMADTKVRGSAAQKRLVADVMTRSGRTYRSARLERIEGQSITIAFVPEAGGVGLAKLPVKELPENLQRFYGCSETSQQSTPFFQLACALAQSL